MIRFWRCCRFMMSCETRANCGHAQRSQPFRHTEQEGFSLSLFYLTFCAGRFLNKSFYDAQQFVDGANLFFDTALEHSDESNTLGRKRFFAEQQLQH